jgi:hypothetical protein
MLQEKQKWPLQLPGQVESAKIIVTICTIFQGYHVSIFNHIIIMKNFHNVFGYYDRSTLKNVKCQRITLLKIKMI